MILGVDVVYIHSSDTEDLGAWYAEVLGLQLAFKTSDSRWQEFNFDDSPSTRFAIESLRTRSSEIEQQSIMISFRVDDVEAMVEKLEQKGVKFYGSQKTIREGHSLFATLQDPAGNWIQLSQRIDDEKENPEGPA
jgi:predicted enzyme related to lactoylglutathione lyase